MTKALAATGVGSEPSRLCPLCGLRAPLAEDWRGDNGLVRCRGCGLAWRAERLDRDAASGFFKGAYYSSSQPARVGTREEFAPWRRRQLARIAARIRQQRPGGRALDVGCADGELLHQLVLSGRWDVLGIEPDPIVAAQASRRLGRPVQATTLERCELEPMSFDVAALLEVLYYFPDPRRALMKIASALTENGLLVLGLPAPHYALLRFGGLRQAVVGRGPLHPPRHHLFLFEWSPLKCLLVETGFQMLRIEMEEGPSFGLLSRMREAGYCRVASVLYRASMGRVLLGRRMLLWARRTR